MEQKYIMAIETGSSKIKGAVGALDQTGQLNVLAIEEEPLVDSVRYGCIQNVEEVRIRINRIIKKLENNPAISPRKIKGAYLALGGRSLMASIREIESQIQEGKGISEQDIETLKQEAINSDLSGNDVIEVIPQDFMVDNVAIQNPIGSVGQNIRTKLTLITCKPQIKKNLSYVFDKQQQLEISGFIVRPLAQAALVLTDDERSLGCMLVDFGAETTTVSIYKGGDLHYLATLPIGSHNITRDLTALNMTESKAEEIKKKIGNVNPQKFATQAKRSDDGIDYTEVNNYVQARTGEIIANIIEQLKYADYNASDLPSGIIVVGGGAKLNGFNSLLEEQSKMTVRSGSFSELINISDTRVSHIDVVSILFAAAQLPNVTESLTPEQIPYEGDNEEGGLRPYESDDDLKNKDGENPSKPEQQTPKKPNFIDRIKGVAENFFTEPIEGENEGENEDE